jgi:hypothetical protein
MEGIDHTERRALQGAFLEGRISGPELWRGIAEQIGKEFFGEDQFEITEVKGLNRDTQTRRTGLLPPIV